MLVGPFRGHKYVVGSVALSPDGLFIVTGSAHMTVRVWEGTVADPIHDEPAVRPAYAPTKSFVAVCIVQLESRTPPGALRDVSDDETASGGSTRQERESDGGNVATNVADISGPRKRGCARHAPATISAVLPSMRPSTFHAAPGPSADPRIGFVAGSAKPDESFERDRVQRTAPCSVFLSVAILVLFSFLPCTTSTCLAGMHITLTALYLCYPAISLGATTANHSHTHCT
ncbi:hypothetical protein F5I97DRAFT_1258331 [Phlebopus sp. FC_14]|nr:hypothetical protein F5I97DRAFT_1258331 [Phlebopus sp. FC_14]